MKALTEKKSTRTVTSALLKLSIIIPMAEFAILVLALEIGLSPSRTSEFLSALFSFSGVGSVLGKVLAILYYLLRAVIKGVAFYFLPGAALFCLITGKKEAARIFLSIAVGANIVLLAVCLFAFKYDFGDRIVFLCACALLKSAVILLLSWKQINAGKLILAVYILVTLAELFFLFYLPSWGSFISYFSAAEKSATFRTLALWLANVWTFIPLFLMLLPFIVLWIFALKEDDRYGIASALVRLSRPLNWIGLVTGFVFGLIFILIGMLTLGDSGSVYEQFGIISIVIWCISVWFCSNTLMELGSVLQKDAPVPEKRPVEEEVPAERANW